MSKVNLFQSMVSVNILSELPVTNYQNQRTKVTDNNYNISIPSMCPTNVDNSNKDSTTPDI